MSAVPFVRPRGARYAEAVLPWGLLIAAAAVAAWGAARLFVGYPAPPTDSRTLRRWERALVEGASDATFPPGGAVPASGREAGVADYVDRWVAEIPGNVRLLMGCLFLLVEHATLVWPAPGPGGRRRFSRLSTEQQVAALEGWRTSGLFPRRLVFTSLRAILCMGYLADPAVLRHLGLAPPHVVSPVRPPDLLYPPVGRPRAAIPYGPEDLTAPSDGTPLPIGGPIHPAYRADRTHGAHGAAGAHGAQGADGAGSERAP